MAFYFISGGVIEGRLTPGDYGVLFFYYSWLSGSLGYLPFIWARIQESVPGIRRVFFLMDLPSELDRDGDSIAAIQDGVRMQHVGFVYPDGRRALRDIDLTANVGEVMALVGPTGAGKTSLGLLLAGLYDPSEGVIEVDGRDVQGISLSSLRAQVSFVFQEPQLFSQSILDNIRYANPSATEQDVERVARLAGAHDFIAALPDGYATHLGTVTSKLSVGQKQRIAIARGLLKDSSVLILDEPTSALDPETEAYLVGALREAARTRLVIIIAHRLSTIAHADQIIFLDEGRIVERGTHEDLLNLAGGHYRRYVGAQT
jgi:ABC-type multidrug transport system fused ATPase/permease subunit